MDGDFDDVFMAGFEELAEDEDRDTGEKAERELHAKVMEALCIAEGHHVVHSTV